jgi:hypothetical protein
MRFTEEVPCPFCHATAELTEFIELECFRVKCPTCTTFQIAYRAKEYIEDNPGEVQSSLALLSRAAQRLNGKLLLHREADIMNIAGEQEGIEAQG